VPQKKERAKAHARPFTPSPFYLDEAIPHLDPLIVGLRLLPLPPFAGLGFLREAGLHDISGSIILEKWGNHEGRAD